MGQSESTPAAGAAAPVGNRKDKERDAGRTRTKSRGDDGSHSPNQRRPVPRPHTPSAPVTAQVSASSDTAVVEHTRARSATSPTAPLPMGNVDSKVRPPSRSTTLQSPPSTNKREPSPLSRPVDVPAPSSHDAAYKRDNYTPPTPSFGLPASVFVNPPRLPLPIERDPEPASPILGPEDAQDTPPSRPQTEVEVEDVDLPSRVSVISSSTLDDDEGSADIQQFAMENDPLAPKVPTPITYRGEGRHVYVTGTFAVWNKKFRMHRDKDGTFRASIPLAPGTHHIIFLVDGEPKTSTDLPTTVDFANALVNYIEVVAPQGSTTEQGGSSAMPIPGAVAAKEKDSPGIPFVDDQPIPGPPGAIDELSTIKATGTPMPNQPASSLRPHSLPRQSVPSSQPPQQQSQQSPRNQQQPKPALKQPIPRPKYTSEIPPILLHLDMYNSPSDPRYRLASKAVQALPAPPSLPMFMSKSILNATTPQKDDASVLTMPNHTVLNHLATSSIRQGVLATSGTTRYKRKFLTTIMYKPTSEDG